jgi:hypothetical protein
MSAFRTIPSLLALAALAACSKSDRTTADSANGTVATGGLGKVTAERATTVDTGNPSNVTPSEGAAQVTAADAKAVTKATEYKLTDDNFRRFVAATDSIAALRGRDPQARAVLDQPITDAGAGTRVSAMDAGRKHLEAYPPLNNAITSNGMSVQDYFVASIAIAQAERFMGDPKAAPPTPALGANAAFLNAHRAELEALRARGRAAMQAK